MTVYCENCKWFYDGDYYRNCFAPNNKIYYDTPSKRTYNLEQSYIDKNYTNNCTDYKRVWWKFWIKER